MSRNNATWQQVSAPNVNGSVEAMLAALKGAGTTLDHTLKGVADARQSGAVGELLQRSLGLNTPEAIQGAMQSGQLTQGIDQRYITPEFVKTLDDRVTAGQNAQHNAGILDINKQRLAQAQQDFDFKKTIQQKELDDKAKAERNIKLDYELQTAINSGNQYNVSKLLQRPDIAQRMTEMGAAGANIPKAAEVSTFAPTLSTISRELGNITDVSQRHDAWKNLLNSEAAQNPTVYNQIIAAAKGQGVDFNDPTSLASVAEARVDNSPTPASAIAAAAGSPTRGSEWAAAKGLTRNESGGKSNAENNAVGAGGKVGHFGLLQFGEGRLTDGKNAGVIPKNMTPQQFRDSSVDFQNKVADWHFDDIDKKAAAAGLGKHYGRVINGVTINQDSIRAMAHLGGINGVEQFINTNGAYDKADRNKTKMSDYGKKYGSSPSPTITNNTQLTGIDLVKLKGTPEERALAASAGTNKATSLLGQSVPKPDFRNMTDTELARASAVGNAQQMDENLVNAAQLRATQLAKYDVSHGADLRATYKDFVKSSESEVIKQMSYDEFAKLYKEYGITKDKSGKELSKIPAARFVGALENSLARGKYSADGRTDSILGSWDGFKGFFGLNQDFSMVDTYELGQNVKEFSKNVPALANLASKIKQGTIEERTTASAKVVDARQKLKAAQKAYSENPNQEGNLRIAEVALEKAYTDLEKIAPIMK